MLIRERTPIRAPLLERLDKLRLISQVGVFPHIDVEACTQRGVIVRRDQAGAAVLRDRRADVGPGHRRVPRIPQEAGGAQGGQVAGLSHRRRPARQDARHLRLRQDRRGGGRLRQGLRHERPGVGPRELARAGRAAGVTVAEQGALFAESDVVSLHLRLIDATRGIVTAADLARMKPTALFVNTSRAGLIAPGALEARCERAGRAWPRSTSSRRSRCWRAPSAAGDGQRPGAPHLGYVERDGLEHMFSTIFDQILAYAAGKGRAGGEHAVPRLADDMWVAGSRSWSRCRGAGASAAG